jgi:uridine monophosphate synthetase
MSFISKIEARARQSNSLLCVGLDPHLDDLPEPTADAAYAFCEAIVSQTKDLVLAYKPNIAFFEALGAEGIAALKRLIDFIPEGIPVILDAKRGDIASTAYAYASAAFDYLGVQGITINPYLGEDSIAPFTEDPEKGIFLLCKTSNPGSDDLQEIPLVSGERVYEHLASMSRRWNANDNVGLVVGATDPQALSSVRRTAPTAWILAPGVGAQGASLETALQSGLRPDGLGMIFPVSRSISRANDPRAEAKSLVDSINSLRESFTASHPSVDHYEFSKLARLLFEAGCVKFGDFTLKSGLQSPIYIDLRILTSFPPVMFKVARAYYRILESLTFDRLAAIPYTAIPIATAVSLQGLWPLVYPRKEAKEYGTKARIEGIFNPGERIAIIDDLTTTGSSKFEIIETLTTEGLQIEDIVVLIDRESGALESLAHAGFRLHAVFTLTQLCQMLRDEDLITLEQQQAVLTFIEETKPA